MDDLITQLDAVSESLDSLLWHNYVLFIVVGAGILFTIWSVFGQYRALTHGVQVVRGKFDKKDDPGAINHFQALSAALSATVGLGNIGGVALAISVGGPGAVFWIWVIGIIGMALKMTEVSLSMLYRNTDDPDNPHGGPMWAVTKGFAAINPGLKTVGWTIGFIFCITLIIATVTGGNMFQAWSVGTLTEKYFEIPNLVTGVVLALLVAMVIIGGIKRIGAFAGRVVPFMCLFYVVAAIIILFMNIDAIPGIFASIFESAFSESEAQGAFIGGSMGAIFLIGMKRALFSNEAGQGSAPIAHSAAKTDEPIREGVVAGLEPFIDTIVICTLTSLVILSSGAWNRAGDAAFPTTAVQSESGTVQRVEAVDLEKMVVAAEAGRWTLQTPALPPLSEGEWNEGDAIFMIARADINSQTDKELNKFTGVVAKDGEKFIAVWTPLESSVKPVMQSAEIFIEYPGPLLTAYAFDRITPGLGMWLVTIASWFFAISTMISWSYYGEQGVIFMMGKKWVTPYKIVYCLLIVVSCLGLVKTTDQLERWSSIGTGVMLWANIPICLILAPQVMKAYHKYMARLKAGEFHGHEAPPIVEVAEGKDVE